jgi:hypothetical protein
MTTLKIRFGTTLYTVTINSQGLLGLSLAILIVSQFG